MSPSLRAQPALFSCPFRHLRQGRFSVSNYVEVARADQDASSSVDCSLPFVASGK